MRREYLWPTRAPRELVTALLGAPTEYPRWWPSGWIAVTEVGRGDAVGRKRVISARTRGRSPFVLEWSARTTLADEAHWHYELFGALEGSLRIAVPPTVNETAVLCVWEVSLADPAMCAAPFAQSLFASDLDWMMREGEVALSAELQRLQGAEMPPPRGQASTSTLPWTLGAVGLGAALAGVLGVIMRRRRERSSWSVTMHLE
jgi:hypothetical protein